MPEQLITINEAQRIVLAACKRLPEERVPVEEALGRTLARDLTAAADVPSFRSSAMDGYAVLPGSAERRLAVAGESRAGAPADRPPGPDQALRISTGAEVPAGAGVIRQEDVLRDGDQITARTPTGASDNVRERGEDMRAGDTVLHAGSRIAPLELGLAVAAGAATLPVVRRPRVRVVCTGDELRGPGESLGPGQIHNSNAATLEALARCAGATVAPGQRLRDDREATEQALSAALREIEVLVICGGMSVGPHDHVKPALAALGAQRLFWGVAIQPGKPVWFGTCQDALIFGLPGNPVSALLTFSLLARPALLALQGLAPERPRTAVLSAEVAPHPSREMLVRVLLEPREGSLVAVPDGPVGSHTLSSLAGVEALARIPPGEAALPAGSTVTLTTLPR